VINTARQKDVEQFRFEIPEISLVLTAPHFLSQGFLGRNGGEKVEKQFGLQKLHLTK
jgi:hypothetical protein